MVESFRFSLGMFSAMVIWENRAWRDACNVLTCGFAGGFVSGFAGGF